VLFELQPISYRRWCLPSSANRYVGVQITFRDLILIPKIECKKNKEIMKKLAGEYIYMIMKELTGWVFKFFEVIL